MQKVWPRRRPPIVRLRRDGQAAPPPERTGRRRCDASDGPAALGDALLMIDEVLATRSAPRTALHIVADRKHWHAVLACARANGQTLPQLPAAGEAA
jgi:hypothetical protein